MTCRSCGATLEPRIVVDLAGKEIHSTLRYGKKDEPLFSCPNGCKKYQMETETGQKIRRQRLRQEL